MWMFKGIRLKVSPGFLLLIAAVCWLDRGVGVVPWALLACAVHELGHVAASAAVGGRVESLSLSAVGAELRFRYDRMLSYGEEMAVAFSGPAANLAAGILAGVCGAWLLSALSLGICAFNLLPILPLDGGRIVRHALDTCMEHPWPDRILAVLAGVIGGVLLGFGAVVAVQYANVTLLLTAGWLLTKIFRGKGEKIK